ncbi:MAG: hypothetical protein AB1458_04405 [Bacteroidota bacterium]
MQEIFFTILVIWLLFRIFGSASVRTVIFNQSPRHSSSEQKKEGETTITSSGPNRQKSPSAEAGEYIDYEEVK